jgi:hypothetical protein
MFYEKNTFNQQMSSMYGSSWTTAEYNRDLLLVDAQSHATPPYLYVCESRATHSSLTSCSTRRLVSAGLQQALAEETIHQHPCSGACESVEWGPREGPRWRSQDTPAQSYRGAGQWGQLCWQGCVACCCAIGCFAGLGQAEFDNDTSAVTFWISK